MGSNYSNFAYSPAEVAQLLAERTEAVIQHLGLNGKVDDKMFCTGDIYGSQPKNKGSLRINLDDINGFEKGRWKDWANPDDNGDLLDLWYLNRGLSNKGEAVREALNWMALPIYKDQIVGDKPKPKTTRKPQLATTLDGKKERPEKKILEQASLENIERHHKMLLKNNDAVVYLNGRGIDMQTIKKFKLGLGGENTTAKGLYRDKFLVFPLLDSDGKFKKKFGNIPIPGVSVCNEEPTSFFATKKTGPLAYYNRAHTFACEYLVIVEGHKDLWALDGLLRGTKYEELMLLVTSSNGVQSIPPELYDSKFIGSFKRVFCLYDNDKPGESAAARLLDIITEAPIYRVKVSNEYLPDDAKKTDGADITDFVKSGADIALFEDLLKSSTNMRSEKISNPDELRDLNKAKIGRYSYEPFNPNVAYHNGNLYYPMEVIRVVYDEDDDANYELLQTIVYCSNGEIYHAVKSKLPRGVHHSKAVTRLNNGDIVSQEPQPNSYATWHHRSAEKWLEGKYNVPPPFSLFERVISHLMGAVALPEKSDYTLLALTAMATYLQNVFDAVPYIFLNGPRGTGKSELGLAMADVSANANVASGVSAATLSRELDKTCGLMVIDDVEEIGKRGSGDSAAEKLKSYLKHGYKKLTATRTVTDINNNNKAVKLNMFGIKILSNTEGVADQPLLQRMYIIKTKRLPNDTKWKKEPLPPEVIFNLRQDLHAWAFSYVHDIALIYERDYSDYISRADEISAPLQAIAKHLNNEKVNHSFQRALDVQAFRQRSKESPEGYLEEACRQVVTQGYNSATVKQIHFEMKTLMDPLEGRANRHEIVEWDKLAWVTNTLNDLNIITSQRSRKTLNVHKLTVVTFTDDFTSKIRSEVSIPVSIKEDPREFCLKQICNKCAYINVCDMQKRNDMNNMSDANNYN